MKQISRDAIRPHIVPVGCLILLTLAVYLRTAGFDFLSNWDDNFYITHNPDIAGFSARNLVRIFTSPYVGNYAPVHMLSYMLDYQLAGLNPAWFHLENVLLHLLNGLLFYALVHRLSGKTFWAFSAAALFLVHPVQVESVAWISQRKNVLAMLFSLCSFWCYLDYCRQEGARKRTYYILSVALLVVALLAKSIAVIMPFVYLLHDFCLADDPRRKGMLTDKLPFFAAMVAASGITLLTQSAGMGGGIIDYFDGSLLVRFLTMLTVLTAYLRILFWPADLSLIYLFYNKMGIDGEVLFALLLVALLFCAGMYLLRRERRLFFGFALFFLGLAPVSQIVPLATLMNDRYLYFPMLGACWILGGYLSRLRDSFPQARVSAAHLVLCLLVVPLAIASYQRAGVWKNAITLWSDTSQKLPVLKDPLAALAEAYLFDGQKGKALETHERILTMKRDFSDREMEKKALLDASGLYFEAGLPEKARPLLITLTIKYPDYFAGFLNLGYVYLTDRKLPEAEKAYRTALRLKPTAPQAYISLGNICLETGRLAEARVMYQKSYENGGNNPDLQYFMACADSLAGEPEKALPHLEEALKLGYGNLDLIRDNPQLAAVRRLPGFGRLAGGFAAGKR